MMDYFVANGGGYVKDSNIYYSDDYQWIDIQVRDPLPAHFDLREQRPGGLQPIKKQRCGDCWAHSVVAAFETAYGLAHKDHAFNIYAQQELISSCGNTGGSCNGGGFRAFKYVVGDTGPGLPMEIDLPYEGHGTSCNDEVKKSPRGVGWAFIGERSNPRGASIQQMKQAMITYNASLSVDVHAFRFTGDGVYTDCGGGGTNHMVNIEGWQDDATVQGGGYWYMRNSWGKSFGKDGYAKVAYTDDNGNKCNNLGETTAVVTKLAN
jgi:C1A family cysteine protease